jgi:uncharacterized protein YdgA (DUF945 family)
MNKIVIAVVAVIAVILLAVPRALGSLTETRVRERVAALSSNGVLSLEVKSYDRGWFHSTAKIEVGVAPAYLAQMGAAGAAAADAARHATIAVDFAHGPVMVQRGLRFGLSSMVAKLDPSTPGIEALEKQLGVPYLFEFRGHTGFGGAVAFDADVPPLDIPAGPAQFKFSGATLDGTYAGERLVSNARIDSFEFVSPGGTFALRNLRAKTDNTFQSPYVAPGEAELTIESVSALDPVQGATPALQADHLRIASTASTNDAHTLLDMRVTYDLDRVHAVDTELSGAALGIAMHNVDVEALTHYVTTVRELGANATPPDPQTLLAALGTDIERALAAGPGLTIDPIRFTLDGEPFEGRVELTTNPSRLPPGGVAAIDPATLLSLVNSQANVRLSKPLARRLAALGVESQLGGDPRMPRDQLKYLAEAQAGLTLVTLVNQGFLVEDGDVYTAALSFADGSLTLNGNPLPLGLQ